MYNSYHHITIIGGKYRSIGWYWEQGREPPTEKKFSLVHKLNQFEFEPRSFSNFKLLVFHNVCELWEFDLWRVWEPNRT